MGSEGCVPIDTPQTISFERLAVGEKPPAPQPKAPKPTAEQIKQKQLEEARQKALTQQQKKQQPKEPPKPQPKELEAEEHEKVPVFDLQDVPIAMEKMGWPVSAKFARKWFAGSKHIWDDDLNSIQPIDDTSVTLEWVLKFGSAKEKYNELLKNSIYNKNAIKKLKEKFKPLFENRFQNSSELSFETTQLVNDLILFHKEWHFQYAEIRDYNTTEGVLSFTDLTGSLANFNIYVAVGYVQVYGDRYYKYDQ